jgi:hypothetical protein
MEFIEFILYLAAGLIGILVFIYLRYGKLTIRTIWIVITLPIRLLLSLFFDLKKIRTNFREGYAKIDSKVYTTKTEEVLNEKSFIVGEKFEDFIGENIFSDSLYTLVEKTHSYSINKSRYVESSMNPDFKFRDKLKRREFWVEVKFRSKFFQGRIEWCNHKQLKRYQSIDQNIPVFIAIGVGGEPEKPHYLSIIPIRRIKYNRLYFNEIEQYTVNPSKTIEPDKLFSI